MGGVMGRFIEQSWPGADRALSLKAQRAGFYKAYIPSPLVGRRVTFSLAVTGQVYAAEYSLIMLNSVVKALLSTESLARLLLRAESIASSKIEGLHVGPKRLLSEEFAQLHFQEPVSETAAMVLKNINAMSRVIHKVSKDAPICIEDILEFHSILMEGKSGAGVFRSEQNWIGRSDISPLDADFIPPPPDYVLDLMNDLCRFSSDDNCSPVIQAALAHAQFETIHPFADGNGRTGRALIHMILRRRGLAERVLAPISLILATHSKEYIKGIQETQYIDDESQEEIDRKTSWWIGLFSEACIVATKNAEEFEHAAIETELGWRAAIEEKKKLRKNSAADLLLSMLSSAPIVSINSAAQLLQRSPTQAAKAINELQRFGILKPIKAGKRNQAFIAKSIVDQFLLLERTMASPANDTRRKKPSRIVPHLQ